MQKKNYYKGTEVLKNKVCTREKITAFRKFLYNSQNIQTCKKSIVRFEIKDLKKIHKYIFQDIYYFAGKFRVENISYGKNFLLGRIKLYAR